MLETEKKISELYQIITTLRSPNGCPWDQKQTPTSLKKYIQEESHELLEAIDNQDTAHICEELGDVMFQLLFIANIFEEQGLFTLDEVISAISDKMIRRHPHVFEELEISCEKELSKHWDTIKAKEQKVKEAPQDLLEAVPKSLPALRRAQKISERAARQGFDWPSRLAAIDKLHEELGELLAALKANNAEEIFDELGDTMFMLVNISRLVDIAAEEALQHTTEKFIRRFRKLDEQVRKTARRIDELGPDELINIWNATKTN